MNNCIFCECVDCGNVFSIPVPDLLEVHENEIIGELVWCGVCDSHSYECSWGMFAAGTSLDKVSSVLRIWIDWATSYRTSRTSISAERAAGRKP